MNSYPAALAESMVYLTFINVASLESTMPSMIERDDFTPCRKEVDRWSTPSFENLVTQRCGIADKPGARDVLERIRRPLLSSLNAEVVADAGIDVVSSCRRRTPRCGGSSGCSPYLDHTIGNGACLRTRTPR
jgi:hypothetical protein